MLYSTLSAPILRVLGPWRPADGDADPRTRWSRCTQCFSSQKAGEPLGETLQLSAEVAGVPAEAQNATLLVYLGSFSFPLFSRCLLSLTLFLTVADVTLPQRGLRALMQDGVGWHGRVQGGVGRWSCRWEGWAKMTLGHFPPFKGLQKWRGIFFFQS